MLGEKIGEKKDIHQHIHDALQWRYATQAYTPESTLTDQELETIITAGRYAPSSRWLDPVRYVVIRDIWLRKELLQAVNNQEKIVTASDLVVVAVEDVTATYVEERVTYLAKTRKIAPAKLEGYKNALMSVANMPDVERHARAREQAHIALGSMLLTAAQLQVDASPMWGFQPTEVDRILQLSEKWRTSVVLMALGHRDPQDPALQRTKARRPSVRSVDTRR